MMKFKKITLLLALIATAINVTAQNKTFEKIARLPEAQYAYISESMLSSMGTMVDQQGIIASAIDNLKSVEILTCEQPDAFDKIRKMLKPCTSELLLLSKLRDDGENIEIYGRRNGDKLSSLLLIKVKGAPEVLSAIFMTGDIDPDSLRSVTKP